MNRRVQLGALTLVGALVVACGGGTGASPSGAAPTEPTDSSPAPSGTVDIEAACPLPDEAAAAAEVDTSAFAQDEPWTLGVSAGYLANAWIAFNNSYVNYAASEDDRYDDVISTDAGFDVSKQVADIEDLITQGVSGIIYWPIDNGALSTVLQQAEDAGIPTVNVANGFSDQAGITSNAQIDNYLNGRTAAAKLAEDLGGEGDIVSVIPIAGTNSAILQQAALECVLEQYPNINLLDTQNGDWDTAKSKSITEAWLQRFPAIDGVFSPSGQMSLGVAEAFEEAGRLDEVTFSPADEYNGWLKWLADNPDKNSGLTTFPVSVGGVAVDVMSRILAGEDVTKGVWHGAEYFGPEEAAAMAVPDQPDDWWPNDLPEEFLP
jgi:ABC-type sugar transport system substrate-binding protein